MNTASRTTRTGTIPWPLTRSKLAEDALRTMFGFNYEGYYRDDDPDLERVILAGFLVSL